MKKEHMITRKEFLKLIGITSLAVLFDACSPLTKKTPEAVLSTRTSIPPTLTLEPTLKINSHIIPEMVLVEAGDFDMVMLMNNQYTQLRFQNHFI